MRMRVRAAVVDMFRVTMFYGARLICAATRYGAIGYYSNAAVMMIAAAPHADDPRAGVREP